VIELKPVKVDDSCLYYITTIGISIPNHIKRQKYEILTRNSMQIKIKKLSQTAITPTKAHITDAGYDLYSDEDVCVGPGERRLIKTGISFEIPNRYVGLIWPRSGLANKKGIDILAGVIDSSFRGEICCILYNTGKQWGVDELVVSKGDRIAQILFQQVPHFNLVEVNELDQSDRGENGFGSSGK
jgi:dUTP pyrophosphatase